MVQASRQFVQNIVDEGKENLADSLRTFSDFSDYHSKVLNVICLGQPNKQPILHQ